MPLPLNIPHFTLRRFCRVLVVRRLLMTVLALLISNAPLPCVHEHQIHGSQVKHSASLTHHVDRYHADAMQSGLAELGWHIHLMLPWQFSDEADPEQPEEPVPALPVTSLELSAECLPVLPANLFCPEFHARQVFIEPLHAQTSSSQFFSTYGCSVAIGDLVSVRLC